MAADTVHQIVGSQQLNPFRFRVEKADQRETKDHEKRDKDRGQSEVEGVALSGTPGGHVRRRSVV